jgi:acyl transferase domain-containing protein
MSVNSFGYGRTNGHIMIEGVDSFLPNYKLGQTKTKTRGALSLKRPFLLPFSAHDKPTLTRNINAYGKVTSKYNLLDLGYMLGNRRSNLQSRAFVVASAATLEASFQNDGATFAFANKKKMPTLGFAFTAQGAQWPKMGAELMAHYPSFLRTIRNLDQALGEPVDGPEWTLEDTLLEDAQTSLVHEA